MDFCEEQYDLLGLGYYRGVISHIRKFRINRTILGLIKKCLGSKMPFSKFKLSKWLIYHKGFNIMTNVIEKMESIFKSIF